ncbi:MAG: hypothetical protein FJW30_09470 [Acidobacteria bacterium]|nr:hypothetical protein [Acidobacteriota bacterium]
MRRTLLTLEAAAVLAAQQPVLTVNGGIPIGDDTGTLCELKGKVMMLLREGHCLRDNVPTVCNRAHAQLQLVFEGDHLTGLFARAKGHHVSPLLTAFQKWLREATTSCQS